MNVIEVIYQKYPCVEEAVKKSGCYLVNMRDACQLLLSSAVWKNYLKNNEPNYYKLHAEDLEKYGQIIPVTLKGLNIALRSKGPFSQEEKQILARTAKVFQIKGMDPRKIQNLQKLCQTIVEIASKGYKPKTYDVFIEDPQLVEIFQDFLTVYLQNTCYLPKDDTAFGKDISKGMFIGYSMRNDPKDYPLFEQNIGEPYIRDIVQENFKESFPELFKSSSEPIYVSKRELPWDQKPEFPKSAILFLIQKETLLVTNFICAKRGPSGENPERDVYGQLICSNKNIRSSGQGKLLLVSTILMAKQFKVNYIFIQAFQGVAGVQTPLYNRIGFNLYFSNELLKRKTAFYQWALVSEEDLDHLHTEYLKGKTDPSKLVSKFQHVFFLKPMWLYVPSYDTRYVCDLIEKPGFDYQTKTTGTMGKISKFITLPKRMLGYETEQGPNKPAPPYVPPTLPKEFERKRDYEKCGSDNDCLSDNCRAGRCIPYDYEESKPPQILVELDTYLKKKGIVEDPEYYRARREAWFDLLAEQDQLELKRKDLEYLRNLQDTIRDWHMVIQKKEKDGELTVQEREQFLKLYEEYKNATKQKKYAVIAFYLIKGVTDSLTNLLFRKGIN